VSDLSAAALVAASRARGLEPPVRFVEEVDSTNRALRADPGAPDGAALVAGRQTAGRGRLGRAWQAPEGTALALSVVLHPALPLARLPLVVLAAGVATAEACAAAVGPVGARMLRLKWPNDLLDVEGRKIAGILAEAEPAGQAVSRLVVGIGINVGAAPSGPFTAGSLADHGPAPDRAALAVDLVVRLRHAARQAAIEPAAVLDAWRRWDGTAGRRVSVGGVTGTALGVGPTGALLVRDAAGREHRVLAGDVEMVSVEGR
jgi:BirA family transcriptional regulator, biotin operon repressor / biotin---[acetyl-CoA-carboxylase] ligase